MAVINYVETDLDKTHKIISWNTLVAGDSGQAFELVGFTVVSTHVRPDASTNLVLLLLRSNEPSAANGQEFFSTAPGTQVEQFIVADPSSRYLKPNIASGSTGGWHIHMLVKES